VTDLDYKKAQRELNPSEECDSVTEMIPANCAHCGETLAGSDPEPIRHQVWGIPDMNAPIIFMPVKIFTEIF